MSIYQSAAILAAILAAISIIFVGFVNGLWPEAASGAVTLLAAGIVFNALHEIIAELKRTNQFLWTAEYDRQKGGK